MRNTRLYTAMGPEITVWSVDADNCALTERSRAMAPQKVHYLWPSRSGRMVYLACSNFSPRMEKPKSPEHFLGVYRVDPATGALTQHQAPIALPHRPVHLTVDAQEEHVLVAYPGPDGVTVHKLRADGGVGEEVKQPADIDWGIYVHQVRALPSGRTVIVVCRGNDAKPGKPEDPGALKVFDYANGVLRNRLSVAPAGGYGFGPRHIDFDPQGRWLYASLERQNMLHVYGFNGDDPTPEPLYTHTTLGEPQRPGYQAVGTVHMHPDGRHVYVANRAHGKVEFNGKQVFDGCENTIAVYRIDRATGRPRLIQNAWARGQHVRCFHIDPTGRMLVASGMTSMTVRDHEGALHPSPSGLALFRVGDDGLLEFVQKIAIESPTERMFWMGMVSTEA